MRLNKPRHLSVRLPLLHVLGGRVAAAVGEHRLVIVYSPLATVRPVREIWAVLGLDRRLLGVVAEAQPHLALMHPLRMQGTVVMAVHGQ